METRVDEFIGISADELDKAVVTLLAMPARSAAGYQAATLAIIAQKLDDLNGNAARIVDVLREIEEAIRRHE